MSLKGTFFIGLMLIALPAFAGEDCATVDLNPQIGLPYDQGETAWCTYHSAAALLSQSTNLRISPGALAALAVTASEEELERLSTAELMNYAKEHSLKGKVQMPEEVPYLTYPYSLKYRMRKDEDGHRFVKHDGIMSLAGREDLGIMMANLYGACTTEEIPDGRENYFDYLTELNFTAAKVTGGTATDSSVDLTRKIVRQWLKYRCGNTKTLTKPQVPILIEFVSEEGDATEDHFRRVVTDIPYRHRIQNALFTEIDRNLERNRASAIGYDACEHEEPNEGDGSCLERTRDGRPGSPHQEHSGVISARKKINGQCRYFLRTHQGSDCDIYKDRFKRDGVCERRYGGIWVNRDELTTIYSVLSIK